MTTTATRAETVALILRQAIRSGRYICGDRLVELTLSQELSVSQNTLRDALHLLENEGWVVKHARRGVTVRTFTAEEALELYALWAVIECLALNWTMETLTKQDSANLRRVIQRAHKLALTGDTASATETLFDVHTAITTLSQRSQTVQLLARLHNQVYLLEVLRQMRAPRSPHAQEAQILLYEKLVSLMEAGETDSAQQLLHYLIMSDSTTMLQLLN